MVRMICCMGVLLTASLAQSAPPTLADWTSQKLRIRFLSLAEARAIALEQGDLYENRLLAPGAGLNNSIQAPKAALPKDSRSSLPVLTGRTPQAESLIVITGVRRDGRRVELERNINQMLMNVENAYWNLYGSYWQLHSREQGLRFAYETWKSVGARYKVGRASLADFAQAEGQYNLFRSQRLQAIDNVLDNERQLRAIVGMKIEDGTKLVPSDEPTLVEKKPDWDKALTEMMKHRPEMRMARADVAAARLNVLLAETISAPVLRFLGVTDCSPVEEASLPGGLSRVTPVAFRPDDPSCVRSAQLQLARTFFVLQEQELKAERYLGLYYRRMSSAYAQIKAARAQHEAFATQMRVRSKFYRAVKTDAALDLLLESQRFWADSLATEYQAIVTYNNALAGWEYAKGAIIDHAHVALTEEPPASCEKVRAVVYERRRTREQLRGEPAALTNSLPGLWKNSPPLRDADELPPVEKDLSRKTGGADPRPIEWKWQADIVPHVRRWVEQTP